MPQPVESLRTGSRETPAHRRQRERLQADVGARVAELRAAGGWTQVQLAERMKVTMRYVQAIELGQQNLSLGSLLKVARALGVEVAALFEKAQPRTPRPGRPRRR